MIRCVKVSSGQSRPYADYVTEWKIFSDESEQHVLDFALKDLARRDMPSKEEWRKNVAMVVKNLVTCSTILTGITLYRRQIMVGILLK